MSKRSNIRFLSHEDTAELKRFLSSPQRPDDTFSFHELQGFLFAIASSPETVAPSEWIPMISNNEHIGFRDEREAQTVLNHVMALYNEVNSAVVERSNVLPTGIVFVEEVALNFKSDSSVTQWSRGFVAGHDWLIEIWEEHLFEELDEECGATTMVLSFFSSRQLAKAYYAEVAPKRRKRGDTSFEDFAETMRSMFPDALASYANIGRTIFEAISKRSSKNSEPATSTKIGRNDPCPCGSGKKYKKCCGGQLH